MCCKLLGIDELRKPASVWCPHAAVGQGCEIYEDRPASCRKFECFWLKSEILPDAMRPDLIKVIFVEDKKNHRLSANVDPDRPDAWKAQMPLRFINLVRSSGTDVIIIVGKTKNLRAQYEREEAKGS